MKEFKNFYDELNWEIATGYSEGTKRKVLRDENGARTVLLKLPKGFTMSPHSHVVSEQDFVLEGEYISKGKKFSKGSYQIFSPHDEHGPFESKEGALILVVWDPIKL